MKVVREVFVAYNTRSCIVVHMAVYYTLYYTYVLYRHSIHTVLYLLHTAIAAAAAQEELWKQSQNISAASCDSYNWTKKECKYFSCGATSIKNTIEPSHTAHIIKKNSTLFQHYWFSGKYLNRLKVLKCQNYKITALAFFFPICIWSD